MHENGMIVGSHTKNHPVMSKLNYASQKNEIQKSFEFLESELNLSYRTYCHPYGGFHSFNNDTISILKHLNVAFSFNVESRDVRDIDLKKYRQFLPRYDCNEFKFGKSN